MVTVVIIGAGSHFTLGLLGDFFRTGLEDAELVLMDINEPRLKAVHRVVKTVIDRRGFNLKVKACVDLREAVDGADYVITTIRAGGVEALKSYVEIPLRHGAVHLVGDTTGPGGVLKALIETPAIISIAEAVEDLSPGALILNFTNPMTTICTAVHIATKVEIIGLCHGVHHIASLTSKLLGISRKELEVLAAGLNHFTWTTGVFHCKENLLPQLRKELFSPDKREVVERHPYLIGRQLFNVFKIPPTLSDRHTAEFFHQLYSWISHPVYGPVLKRVSGYIDFEKKRLSDRAARRGEEWYARIREVEEGRRGVSPSGEYALDIVSARERGETRLLLAANVPNKGLIEGLPDEVAVEVPVFVSKSGVHGIGVDLPSSVKALLNLHAVKYVLLARGIVEKDLGLVEEALNLDPLTPSPEIGHRIMEEFLASWGRYLKQYGFKTGGCV